MENNKKFPLLAGMLNMLIPGSVHIYVKKKWRNFIFTFIGMEIALVIVIWFGTSLQSAQSFKLPQGVCPGAFALFILVPLFLYGSNAAKNHNKIMDDEVLYSARKPVSRENEDEQLRKIQKMRDEGLISEQQFNTRRSQIVSKR